MNQPVRSFGKYELLERVSVGGMAEVFRARHRESGETVALKRILPNVAEDDEFIEEFHDESRIACQLDHPAIARIIDVGAVDASHYIAFEFVEGRSLRSLLDRGQPLPLELTLYVISQVAQALAYAHAATDGRGRRLGVVHRDVSPGNVLLSFNGDVKLIDFGIAKAEGRITSTQAGNIKGKLGYMSPEQVSGKGVDERSDVFSLGICLWECLTGERLFNATNEVVLISMIRSREILSPSQAVASAGGNRKIPPELDKIVLKALAKDVNERYATASQFDDDLRAFAQRELPKNPQSSQASHGSGGSRWQASARESAKRFMQGAFPQNASSPVPSLGVHQENRMSDKGGSDLDVFDGLANKKSRTVQMPSGPSAPAPPSGPPSARPPTPPPAPRQKTLLGLPAPTAAPAPPPSRGPAPPPSRTSGPPGPPTSRSGGSLPPPAVPSQRGSLPPRPPPPSTAAPVDMDWDDEDEKTAIYDKSGTEDAARALLRSAPPPAAGAPPPPASAAGLVSSGAPPPPPGLGQTMQMGPQSQQPHSQQPGYGQQVPPSMQPHSMQPQMAPHSMQPQSMQPMPAQAVMHAPPQQSSGARSALLAVAALLVVGLVAAAILLLRPPGTGKLVVTVSGPNNRAVDALQVYVDGAKKCEASPCILKDIEAGTHMVRVVASGYQETADQAIKVPGGDEALLKVDLAPATGGTGVKVTAEGAGLKLYVDGKEIGPLPQELKDMTPGEKVIKVAGSDRFEPWEQKVTVAQDQMKDIGPLKLKVKKGLAHIKLGPNAAGARVVLVSGNDRRPIPSDKLSGDRGLKIDITTDKPYRIEATKSGFSNYRKDIVFEDGEAEKTFEITMYEVGKEPPPDKQPVATGGGTKPPPTGGTEPPAATGNGTININSIPVSNVILDGRPLGQTPKTGISVSAGNHTVVFVHPEHGRKVRSAKVDAGKSVTVAVRFP
ncbi:MAG: protein kinase [Polyangiaceae bacterium]